MALGDLAKDKFQTKDFAYPLEQTATRSPSGILLGDILGTISDRWSIILGVSFLGGVLMVALSFFVTPTFRATAIYAPAERNQDQPFSLGGQASDLARLVGITPQGSSNIQRLGALVEARTITLQILKDENVLPLLFPNRWDGESKRWMPKQPTVFQQWFGEEQTLARPGPDDGPSDEDILRAFEGKRSVVVDQLSRLIKVEVTLSDPETAARLANRLAYYVNESQRNVTRQEAERAVAYLQTQLDSASQSALRESLTFLLQDRLRELTLLNARENFVLDVVDPAIIPEYRAAPSRFLYALLGIVFGGGIALFSFHYIRTRKRRTSTRFVVSRDSTGT